MLARRMKYEKGTILKELGQGAQGRVSLQAFPPLTCVQPFLHRDYRGIPHTQVIKEIGFPTVQDALDRLMKEEAVLGAQAELATGGALSRSDYVVKVLGGHIFEDRAVIVMEQHGDGGTMADWLAEPRLSCEKDIVLSRVARALRDSHHHHICHLDVKPHNVLLVNSQPYTAKVADYGVGRFVKSTLREVVGTHPFIAPEVRQCNPDAKPARTYTVAPAADWWSYGMTVFAAYGLSVPLSHEDSYHVMVNAGAAAYKGDLEKVRQMLEARSAPPHIINLILGCLHKDPEARYGYKEVMYCLNDVVPYQPTPPTCTSASSAPATPVVTAVVGQPSMSHATTPATSAEAVAVEVTVHVTLGPVKSPKVPKTSKTWAQVKNLCKDLGEAMCPKPRCAGSAVAASGKNILTKAASGLGKISLRRLLPTCGSTAVVA
jgi:serine/threonine protein kinase